MRAALLALVLLGACNQQAPTQAPSPEVQRVVDEAELKRIANAIDDAVDRKDWVAARSFFTDQIDADFSTLGGTPSKIPADELIANWKAALPPLKSSFHQRGEATVTFKGDTAVMVSRGYAWNKLDTRAEDNLWEVWGVYEHHFVRTAQGWKVSGFTFTKTNERGDPAIRTATP
jgi:hypothetical protein